MWRRFCTSLSLMTRGGPLSSTNWSSSWPEKVRSDRQIDVGLTGAGGLRRLAPGQSAMVRFLPVYVVLLSLVVPTAAVWAGSMYQFEDEQGVVHYTNVPGDPRYSFVRKEPEPTVARPTTEGVAS